MVQCCAADPQPLLLRVLPEWQGGTGWLHAHSYRFPCVPANAAAGLHGEQKLLQ
jgi:hypothetical protein